MKNWDKLLDSSKKTFLDYLRYKKVSIPQNFEELELTKKGRFFYLNKKIIKAEVATKLYILGFVKLKTNINN